MFLHINPLYWGMMIPVLLLSIFASFRVKSAFNKYKTVKSQRGMTGAEVASAILQLNGLSNINVVESGGFLTDHYDPRKKVIRLSPEIYNGDSLAAVGIAAHEAGHAVQHGQSYKPLMVRNAMVPMASIGSNFAYFIIIIGFIMNAMGMVKIGIVLFSVVVLFQLINLPVEFNASTRAKKMLSEFGFINTGESGGVSQVLNAAAMTYVAAAASALVTLLYFLIRSGLLGGRDD